MDESVKTEMKGLESQVSAKKDANDWKKDLLDQGLSDGEIYTGSEQLEYGRTSLGKTAGGKLGGKASKDASPVKTLQALLNRALKNSGLGTACADGSTVSAGGKLDVDGQWGLSTVSHLIYFMAMNGHRPAEDGLIQQYTAYCTPEIWKELREGTIKDTSPVMDRGNATDLYEIPGTSKYLTKDGVQAYNVMKKDCPYTMSLSAAYRTFSSHAMISGSGQLELFALRVVGKRGSAARMPTLSNDSGTNHQTGRAIDISSAKQWVKDNGKKYGFEGISSENWHFNFKKNLITNANIKARIEKGAVNEKTKIEASKGKPVVAENNTPLVENTVKENVVNNKVDDPVVEQVKKPLDAKKEADAIKWYSDKKFTADLIKKVQLAVDAEPTGIANATMVQAVAAWQELHTPASVDGEFGKTSAGKTGDKQLEAEIIALLTTKSSTVQNAAKQLNITAPVEGSKDIADFLRLNFPAGFNICFAHKRGKDVYKYNAKTKKNERIPQNDDAFTAEADKFAVDYSTIAIDGTGIKKQAYRILSNKENLINDINLTVESVRKCLAAYPQEGFDDSKCARIKNLAIMTHGYVSEKGNKDKGGLSFGGNNYLTEDGIKGFVSSIHDSLADDVRVQLYACNCARNQRQGTAGENGSQVNGDWYDRGPRANVSATDNYANGDNSFADVLAEEIGENASVYGHTTKGHATGNFAARVYGKDAGHASNGVSMFDVYFPQSFVTEQAERLHKDEVTIRTSMYTYYRANFKLDDDGRGSFIDPEGHGAKLREGWVKEN